MTKKEFILQQKAFEQGEVAAFKGLMYYCKIGVKVHKEELTKKRLNKVADLNKHLWEK